MKKLLVTLLFVTMSIALIGCGKTNEENLSSGENVSSEEQATFEGDSVSILTDVWNTYAEEEKFPAMGGDYTTMVDGAPGAVDVTKTEDMTAMLQMPAELAGQFDEAASLVHGMNLNTFTSAALHLPDASNADAFTTTLKDSILGTQWMCGFPDTLVIFTVHDEYVVYAFGNVDAIANFKDKLTAVFGENAILVAEENLAG